MMPVTLFNTLTEKLQSVYYFQMSILPLLLLVGVASSKYINYHDNDAVLQPIASKSQTRRICAELCLSGLGGEPCGEYCQDILPQGLPVKQSNTSNRAVEYNTRRDACPVLCENQLGYPLCNCDKSYQQYQGKDAYYKTDFVQICGFFCIKYDYKIYGCQPCKLYKDAAKKNGSSMFDVQTKSTVRDGVNWEEWCKEMCSIGDGGAACNCDILPMKLPAKTK